MWSLRLIPTLVLLATAISSAQQGQLGPPQESPQAAPAPPNASFAPPAAQSAPSWINTADRQAVRTSYLGTVVPAQSVAIAWTGSIASGNAGSTSAAYKEAVRTTINWFRAMAGFRPPSP
ncbi:MAG: hypothetical protein R2748_18130 [Bryobacterales bacterium]